MRSEHARMEERMGSHEPVAGAATGGVVGPTDRPPSRRIPSRPHRLGGVRSWLLLTLVGAVCAACGGDEALKKCEHDVADAHRQLADVRRQLADARREAQMRATTADALRNSFAGAVLELAKVASKRGSPKAVLQILRKWRVIAEHEAIQREIERWSKQEAKAASCARPKRISIFDLVVEPEVYDGRCVAVKGVWYDDGKLSTGQSHDVRLVGHEAALSPKLRKRLLRRLPAHVTVTGIFNASRNVLDVQRFRHGW